MNPLILLKSICDRYPRWVPLMSDLRSLGLISSTLPEQVSDKCKTLAETTLKNILTFSGAFAVDEVEAFDMVKLTNEVVKILDFSTYEEKLFRAQLIFLTEIRNSSGTAGHGRAFVTQERIRAEIDESLNERIIRVVDPCLAGLVEIFENKFPTQNTKSEYEQNEDFNSAYDDDHLDIVLDELSFKASFVLYSCDPVAYKQAVEDDKEKTDSDSL
jgi:hypothetical protein